MSYTFYSFRNRDEQDIEQWAQRTVEGEIESCEGRTLERIFGEFLPKAPLRVLEAGCGLGGWIFYLRENGYDIVGLDYDHALLSRTRAYDRDVPLVAGDVNSLSFLEEAFDAYISLGVIEHFQRGPQDALAEAYRVLRPGGLAFITVPYLSVFRRVFSHPLRNVYFALRRIRKGRTDYFWEYRYSKKELAQFLHNSEFEEVYTGIDDYVEEDKKRHIGLYADFFFLRSRDGEIWELNRLGRWLLAIGKKISPWAFCSGLHMVVRKKKSVRPA